MTGTSIIGWAHLPFGKHADKDIESMMVEAGANALKHAGVAPKDIDAIFVGHFNAGFSVQDFPSSLSFGIDPALRFKPATRVENACATGSAAVHQGIKEIAARQARLVLVIGVEHMTNNDDAAIGRNLLKASYVKEEADTPGGFAGVFGRIAELYFQRYGDQSDALARIAAKNHRNGVDNPYAQIRKDLGYEFCRNVSDKNPLVAGPLKRTDCSLVSDGAAALVLADLDTALAADRAVVIRSVAQVNDFLPMRARDIVQFEGCSLAWSRALAKAKLTLDDLSFVETHDCFTIAELIEYEAMGLTPPGEGHRAIEEGWVERDGRLPVNPSGGLKAKGHPVGATGVRMIAELTDHVTGRAGDRQVEGAKLGAAHTLGGPGMVSTVCVVGADA